MVEWSPIAALPNVELDAPIEARLAALVSFADARVQALCDAHPSFRKFLTKFTDAFGVRHLPTVMLVRADAPRSVFTAEAFAGFRDAVSLSVVPYNRALELKHERGHRIQYANTFALYPWMLGNDYKYLIAQTPAILGVHDVEKFRGQLSPEIFHMGLMSSGVDEVLLKALLARWRRRYATKSPKWPERALFRSLNMANQASLLPAGTDATLYDFGRQLALWVSAFEILAHPGEGRSDLFAVYELFDNVGWELKATARAGLKAHEAGRKNKRRRRLAHWLYGELYKARNDFLHGNPLPRTGIFIKRSGRSLFRYAAPLYRLALTGFLPLSWTKQPPSVHDAKAFGKYCADHWGFMSYQRTFEEAIATAPIKLKKHEKVS